ncbi:hypothetical protein SEA_SKOG_214 [Gordonia phage Skog]|uniref:Uncharacterized protein n=1 Tax=Gordonia phage Skog TaxID=2704033 RepID=A0A6G6XK12_9CAUD|nr:hypothetical protein KHQ85_gp214 [Gordonia phage Skog]QIG58366.1 hypothetical protein SEA_SKOG_214 [Gordonia phage Skog]
MSDQALPENAFTLEHDEGVGYTLDAFRAAQSGTVVWCVDGDRADDDPPAMAVMISTRRYAELLDKEEIVGGLSE